MKKKKALFFIIPAIVVILALAAVVCYEIFFVKRGLVQTAEGTYYYNYYGKAYTGFTRMPDGTYRYFDPVTYLMATGEKEIDGNKYFFDSNGVMAFGPQKTGDATKYYDLETGIMQTGWVDSRTGKMYFNEETGEEAFGLTVIDGVQYFFDKETGLMATGDVEIDGEKYSFDYGRSTLFGHSQGGVFTHYAAFNYDLYENRPFANYIIGSPTFWTPYFTEVPGHEAYEDEYGYFERNKTYGCNLLITAGDMEDEDYAEYYGENDSTLEGVEHLKERLTAHGVTSFEVKIYNSHHYQYVPEMLIEYVRKPA